MKKVPEGANASSGTKEILRFAQQHILLLRKVQN